MANFLKINKKSLGQELIENPNLSFVGPEQLLNNDFSEYYSSNYSEVEGVNFNDWKTDKDLQFPVDGVYKLEPIDGGYKQTVVTPVSLSSRDYQQRLSQIVSNKINLGPQILSFKVRVSEDSQIRAQVSTLDSPVTTSNQQYLPNVFDVKASNDFTEINIPFRYQGVASGNVYLQFWREGIPTAGSSLEIKEVSLKETNVTHYNIYTTFAGFTNGTDVTTLSKYETLGSPVSTTIDSGSLVIETDGENQGVRFRDNGVSRNNGGTEVNIKIAKIESVSGLPPGGATMYIDGIGNVDCSAGYLDLTFTFDTSFPANLDIYFKAGDNTAGITRYTNIEITRTKKIPVGFTYPNIDPDIDYDFSGSFLTVRGSGNPILDLNSTAQPSNYIFSYEVLRKDKEVPSFYVSFSSVFANLNQNVGSHKFYFSPTGSSPSLFFGFNVGSDNVFELGNFSFKEVVNTPKLIGVDSVSRVSAPTNNTVVITNGLTDGADTITITYDESEVSSTVEMRNYFQDKIIEAANSNNTNKIIEVNPPATIIDIIAS